MSGLNSIGVRTNRGESSPFTVAALERSLWPHVRRHDAVRLSMSTTAIDQRTARSRFARPSASVAARMQKVIGSDGRVSAANRAILESPRPENPRRFAAGLPERSSTSALSGTKKPLCERLYPKRLMGLEPTTFCMASSG
jgi:hypothetical protein